jgi:hypothetical protein
MRNQTGQDPVRVEEIKELVGLNDQAVEKLVEAVAMGKLARRCPWVREERDGKVSRPPCLGELGLEDGPLEG